MYRPVKFFQYRYGTAITPGADIHYTTNGVDSAPSDATASGGMVRIDQRGTLKARTWAAGMPASNVVVATYTMNLRAPVRTLAETAASTTVTSIAPVNGAP
jgi:hypothetical protein